MVEGCRYNIKEGLPRRPGAEVLRKVGATDRPVNSSSPCNTDDRFAKGGRDRNMAKFDSAVGVGHERRLNIWV